MPGAQRTVTFNAPVEKCWAVISDYERYPEFLPEVKKIRTVNRRGAEVDVQYEVDLRVKVIKYTVHMKEEAPKKLSWSFIDGEFMKDNKGGWQLEDAGNGTTKATYSVEVEVGMLVPKAILTGLVDSQLPSTLENFKKRIESQK
ncbi:MAG: SRPBCC family protein [Myxococcaceae bacterium]